MLYVIIFSFFHNGRELELITYFKKSSSLCYRRLSVIVPADLKQTTLCVDRSDQCVSVDRRQFIV